jgi:hypothetical protein
MDASGTSTPLADGERERLARAHHEICTALTVLRSNAALVRIQLRGASRPGVVQGAPAPVHALMDEIERAVERLHGTAREMRRWHDGVALHPGSEANRAAAALPAALLSP